MTEKLIMQLDEHGIGVLVFNRPETRNALDFETMTCFAQTIDDLAREPGLRVLIITGAGVDAFCSGGDLSELSRYPTQEDGSRLAGLMGDALLQMEHIEIPVIGAVNGYALGGGSEIALACDMRIADEKVRLGMIHIRLGVTPAWGTGQRLLRLVGYARAMEILLRGRAMHAHELVALGLVNRVVAAGTALEHALNFARHIAKSPPDVVRDIKKLLRTGMYLDYESALSIERELFPPLWAADEHHDAVEQFLRSRKQ